MSTITIPALPSSASLLQRVREQGIWLMCSLTAAALLAVAAFLPLWGMTFQAPQYPQGLQLTAYGTKLEGDLEEVNMLNHYVGVAPVEPDDIRELELFPYTIVALLAVVVFGGLFARSRLLRAAAAASVWLFILGFLLDIQWWLYRAGHDLNPEAPIRVDEFTARVFGTTKVVNFYSDAAAGPGLWLILSAAVLLTAGPAVMRFLYASWQNTGGSERSAQRAPGIGR